MKLLKKPGERMDTGFDRIEDIANMLYKEGKQNGECRQFIFMASYLLEISLTLRRFCSVLFILLGFVIGKFISGLL